MAASVYVIDNPRRVKAKQETKPFAISKYEHLEQLIPTVEEPGCIPKKRSTAGEVEIDTNGSPKFWRTRRRRDGKVFLAAEFIDTYGVIDDAKETLLRLLNHPNLVSLVDVVRDTDVGIKSRDYTVWEDCNRGTLNRLLWSTPGKESIEIPESLCWHVLDGISQALLWLHCGHKHTFPFDRHMHHDDDWHPILISEINPTNIYFSAAEGNETYGEVKLGCFRSAAVRSTLTYLLAIKPPWLDGEKPYMAPEIQRNTRLLSPAAEIWSLGAVVYHMMVGEPPTSLNDSLDADENDFWVRPIPRYFSQGLKGIVRRMLRLDAAKRPTAMDLSVEVGQGMNVWREDTFEGEQFIAKGEYDGEDTMAGLLGEKNVIP